MVTIFRSTEISLVAGDPTTKELLSQNVYSPLYTFTGANSHNLNNFRAPVDTVRS